MMRRFVDLTPPLRPGTRGISSEPACLLERDGWNAAYWTLYSHAGAHMDAPIHFGASHATIDQTPLETCIGRAWIADLRPCTPSSLHQVAHLGAVADRVEPGDSLLLLTGWSRHLDKPELFREQLPRVSEELAHWCVAKSIKMLGIEPPSVANVLNLEEVTAVHRILLDGGVTIVEGLTHLDQLGNGPVRFFALPLKLQGGDGSPVRAFAEVPNPA